MLHPPGADRDGEQHARDEQEEPCEGTTHSESLTNSASNSRLSGTKSCRDGAIGVVPDGADRSSRCPSYPGLMETPGFVANDAPCSRAPMPVVRWTWCILHGLVREATALCDLRLAVAARRRRLRTRRGGHRSDHRARPAADRCAGITLAVTWPDAPVAPLLAVFLPLALVAADLTYPLSYTIWQAIDLTWREVSPDDFSADHIVARAARRPLTPSIGRSPRRNDSGRSDGPESSCSNDRCLLEQSFVDYTAVIRAGARRLSPRSTL